MARRHPLWKWLWIEFINPLKLSGCDPLAFGGEALRRLIRRDRRRAVRGERVSG
ncbi:MAG: hypothetical protein V2G51_03960 [bacterium JZ-2024 1]